MIGFDSRYSNAPLMPTVIDHSTTTIIVLSSRCKDAFVHGEARAGAVSRKRSVTLLTMRYTPLRAHAAGTKGPELLRSTYRIFFKWPTFDQEKKNPEKDHYRPSLPVSAQVRTRTGWGCNTGSSHLSYASRARPVNGCKQGRTGKNRFPPLLN